MVGGTLEAGGFRGFRVKSLRRQHDVRVCWHSRLAALSICELEVALKALVEVLVEMHGCVHRRAMLAAQVGR